MLGKPRFSYRSALAGTPPILVEMAAVVFRNRYSFSLRSQDTEATFMDMLLKPSVARWVKPSSVEEVCAQGWVRKVGWISG